MDTVSMGMVGIVPLFVGAEWAWSRWRGRRVYDRAESLATVGVSLGMRASRTLALPLTLAFYTALSPWALAQLRPSVLTFAIALLATDLIYYWFHRASHEIALLWALHQTHHSAEHMNLLGSARLNWLGPWLVQPLLGVPLVLIGVPAEIVALVAAVDLVFQFFLHTEAVGRLPWLEGWLNTPATHRMHHARNERCLDVNYAGIFVVWDRLFGTWVAPEIPMEELDYGLTTGPQGHNPLWLVFGGLIRWARGEPI